MQQQRASLACINGSESIVASIEPGLKPHIDIFDYIERLHNPRKRRQLEMRQKQNSGLTKLSEEME